MRLCYKKREFRAEETRHCRPRMEFRFENKGFLMCVRTSLSTFVASLFLDDVEVFLIRREYTFKGIKVSLGEPKCLFC